MRINVKPRKRNAPRPAEKSAQGFLQWLRGRECACGAKLPWCGGPIVAAHVDHAGGKGMATKVADRHCIPLSDGCHRWQHSMGWPDFEAQLPGKDAVALAAAYWRAWPGRIAYERKLAELGK